MLGQGVSTGGRNRGHILLHTQEAKREQEVGEAINPQSPPPGTYPLQQGCTSRGSIISPNSTIIGAPSVQMPESMEDFSHPNHHGCHLEFVRIVQCIDCLCGLTQCLPPLGQVRLMKRIAEMTDIKPILRKLPRIKKYLLNCDNMRWVPQLFPDRS